MQDLAGKGAFITGGASGIGLGMAMVFARAGMNVVIADVRQDHLDAAQAELAEAGLAGKVQGLLLDVTDRDAYAAAAHEVERLIGKLHVLCNNVGVSQRKPIDEAAYEDWDYVLNVNLGGTIAGLVEFLPGMKAHGEGGHVVNTSSMAGMIPVPAFAGVYAAAKFAVRGLSDSLRLALAPYGIGVSVLCPGMVKTRAMTAGDVYRQAHEGAGQISEPLEGETGQDEIERWRVERRCLAIHDHEVSIEAAAACDLEHVVRDVRRDQRRAWPAFADFASQQAGAAANLQNACVIRQAKRGSHLSEVQGDVTLYTGTCLIMIRRRSKSSADLCLSHHLHACAFATVEGWTSRQKAIGKRHERRQ